MTSRAIGILGILFQIVASGCGTEPRYSYGRGDLDGSGSYFRVRRDVRRCASPLCGGFFVAELNQAVTPCRDGTSQAECYVAEADWTRLGPEGAALDRFRNALLGGTAMVRGEVAPRTYADFGDLGVLVVTEAWVAATSAPPSGTFYRVYDTGLRCATPPCFSLRADVLHADDTEYLSGLDLAPVRAAQEQVIIAEDRLQSSAILVAGTPRAVPGTTPGIGGYELVAAQFYLRTLGQPATACGGLAGGACAGGQICDVTLRGACRGTDLPGVCVAVPDACAEIYQPVCGCDGQTYGNDCERLSARVQIDHEGPCGEGQACAGFIGGSCADGQFCDITIPQACNGADLPGICRRVGDACIEIYQPVCGCDGQTYGNDCFRRAARVQLNHEGPC